MVSPFSGKHGSYEKTARSNRRFPSTSMHAHVVKSCTCSLVVVGRPGCFGCRQSTGSPAVRLEPKSLWLGTTVKSRCAQLKLTTSALRGTFIFFSGVGGTTCESCEVTDAGKWRLVTKRASRLCFKLRPFLQGRHPSGGLGMLETEKQASFYPAFPIRSHPLKRQHLAVTPAFLLHITCRSFKQFTKYATKNELFKRRTSSWSRTQSPATCISLHR